MTQTTALAQNLSRVNFLATRTAFVGALLMAVGFLFDREQFYRSYLFAYLAWLAPSLGSLAIVMLHNMTGGQWGFAIRRLLEAGIRTIPFQAVLFLPLLLGIHSLYEWSHDDVVAADPILQSKAAYLNETFFSVRALVYFLAWIVLARGMVRASERYDRTLDISQLRKTKVLSGIGLAVYVLTMSFACGRLDHVPRSTLVFERWYGVALHRLARPSPPSALRSSCPVASYLSQREPMKPSGSGPSELP